MRNFMLIAVGAALLASTPLTASADNGQNGPPDDRRSPRDQPGPDVGPGADSPRDRPGMGPGRDRPGPDREDGDGYGRWDNGWGPRPPPPPRAYRHHGNWYQHVRACKTRYRSYNPRTDAYVLRRGVTARCRL